MSYLENKKDRATKYSILCRKFSGIRNGPLSNCVFRGNEIMKLNVKHFFSQHVTYLKQPPQRIVSCAANVLMMSACISWVYLIFLSNKIASTNFVLINTHKFM